MRLNGIPLKTGEIYVAGHYYIIPYSLTFFRLLLKNRKGQKVFSNGTLYRSGGSSSYGELSKEALSLISSLPGRNYNPNHIDVRNMKPIPYRKINLNLISVITTLKL